MRGRRRAQGPKPNSMAIFLTGSTGYIGAHIAAILLERHSDRLNLLVRAKTEQEADERLWHALQLHLDFPEFQRCSRDAHFHISRRSHRSAFRPGRRRILAPGRNDRVGDSLRRIAQPQIRKELPQREPARHAGSRATGSPRAGRARPAPLQPGLDRRRGRRTQPRSRHRGRLDRLEPLRLRSLRAHEKILRAHGARTASRSSAHGFSPEHRAGRQPPRGNHAIRHGSRVRVSCRTCLFCRFARPTGSILFPWITWRNRSSRCTRRRIRSTRSTTSPRAPDRKRLAS